MHLPLPAARSRSVAAACAVLCGATLGSAQEIEPRRWSHMPTGVNFAGAVYAHTAADVAFDPVLLIEDAEQDVDTYALRYIRTFELLGKSSRLDLNGAYQQATWEGLLDGQPARVYRSGWADPILRFAVNLLGAPPLRGEAFARYRAGTRRETIVGAALAVHPPLGEYLEDKLLNLGSNRFTIRPQVGAVHTRGRWSFEATGDVWLYTDNDEFFGGRRREQEPLYTLQAHVAYTYGPGLWVIASAAYATGAQSTIDGVAKNDRREDVVGALGLGFPVTRRIGGKIGYLGQRRRESVGADGDTFTLGISGLW
jgi:hypothetical protein